MLIVTRYSTVSDVRVEHPWAATRIYELLTGPTC